MRHTKNAFTLVEILIVVAILGILAAVVIPAFENYSTKAKESAARESLFILRTAIGRYAAQHNDVPPGYLNGDTTTEPFYLCFASQLCKATNTSGQIASLGTPGYPLGPYIPAIPANPFNNIQIIEVLGNNEDFPADATGSFGWAYKPTTKTIKLDWPGADSKGIRYYDY
jgi:prepilin-type N-terminal cleavage/methylation domain-containing protein